VTIGLLIRGFILVVSFNQPPFSHCFWDVKLQRYWGHNLDLMGSRDVIVTWPLGIPIRGQFEPTVYLARLLRYWASKFWGYDPGLLGSRDVICHVSYRWSFESWNHCSISHHCWDIMCQFVKHLAKHIPVENTLIPFLCFRGKIGGYSIVQLCDCSRPLGKSFELLSATIGPQASLLRHLDLPIEHALLGWKIGAK